MAEIKPEDRKVEKYAGIEQLIIDRGWTPVLIVIGGSCVTEAYHDGSDVDLIVYVTEDLGERISIGQSEIEKYVTSSLPMKMKVYPLKWAHNAIWNHDPDFPYYRIYCLEDVLLYPRIFEDLTNQEYADYKAEAQTFLHKDFADIYMFKSKEFVLGNPDDHNRILALRLALTGAYLLTNDAWELDMTKLCTWAGITFDWPKFRDAAQNLTRERSKGYLMAEILAAQALLQTKLDKL